MPQHRSRVSEAGREGYEVRPSEARPAQAITGPVGKSEAVKVAILFQASPGFPQRPPSPNRKARLVQVASFFSASPSCRPDIRQEEAPCAQAWICRGQSRRPQRRSSAPSPRPSHSPSRPPVWAFCGFSLLPPLTSSPQHSEGFRTDEAGHRDDPRH